MCCCSIGRKWKRVITHTYVARNFDISMQDWLNVEAMLFCIAWLFTQKIVGNIIKLCTLWLNLYNCVNFIKINITIIFIISSLSVIAWYKLSHNIRRSNYFMHPLVYVTGYQLRCTRNKIHYISGHYSFTYRLNSNIIMFIYIGWYLILWNMHKLHSTEAEGINKTKWTNCSQTSLSSCS